MKICPTPQDTRAHASSFAKKAKAGDIILLYGDLGAGKTEWVKGFAQGMKCDCEVTSPTTLIHEYRGGRLTIYHCDFYRLDKKTDWSAIDLEKNGVTLVEWPEKFPYEWPSHATRIRIEILPNEQRKISVQ